MSWLGTLLRAVFSLLRVHRRRALPLVHAQPAQLSHAPHEASSTGVVWLTPGTVNNPVALAAGGDTQYAYLREQANVVSTLIRNAELL